MLNTHLLAQSGVKPDSHQVAVTRAAFGMSHSIHCFDSPEGRALHGKGGTGMSAPTSARSRIPKPSSQTFHSTLRGVLMEVGGGVYRKVGSQHSSHFGYAVSQPRKPKRSGSFEGSCEALAGGYWASLAICVCANPLIGLVSADVYRYCDECSSRRAPGRDLPSPRKVQRRQALDAGWLGGWVAFGRCMSHDGET